jgi:1-deoxy-D-xylulose-5-phosphate reductoisomerase
MKGLGIKRRVSILGSTGSVGSSTLEVIRHNRDLFDVVSLSAGSSLDSLASQILDFNPRFASVADESMAEALRLKLPEDAQTAVFSGREGHRFCVENSRPDVLISAMVGSFGLEASLQAIIQGVPILGIANKEILVMAGDFIWDALNDSKTTLVPVDSEHSAIFQSLMGNKISQVKSLILTGSGGPFRSRDLSTFSSITKEEALRHPNWVMGPKITVDSATMMNKGLEFIEALRLFRVHRDQVKVVIHPESVVHSMVEFCDGSVISQMGHSDMKIPISLALSYPDRLPLEFDRPFDLTKIGRLHFEEPDLEKFRCLKLAMNVDFYGRSGPIVLNSANEAAVGLFLKEKLRFVEIAERVEAALETFRSRYPLTLSEVVSLDEEVKNWVYSSSTGSLGGRRDGVAREMILKV